MSQPRRNPKRKACEATSLPVITSSNLLEEALKPLSAGDIEEWEGWVELESEPAFFNFILRDWGVQGIKAEEIFTIEQSSLNILPQPVHGLIFLFQYAPTIDDSEGEGAPTSVWFANQTTSNACATVALLNIVMNAQNVDLGDKLRAFKDSTKDLSTILRGHQLSNNGFLRKTHNSFTRRMDHLNADLCLENDIEDENARNPKKRVHVTGNRKKRSGKKKRGEDYGFHFIAYVPSGGCVWELDGLKSNPVKIGTIKAESWTELAQPQIEARMLQYEEGQLSFNLLALCQSPLAQYSSNIAQNLASLRLLNEQAHKNPISANTLGADCGFEKELDLTEFNLERITIEKAEVPMSLRKIILRPSLGVNESQQLHEELVIETKAAIGEYRSEMIAMAQEQQRVEGRKKDFSPALHKWVSKLAEKGVLEEALKNLRE